MDRREFFTAAGASIFGLALLRQDSDAPAPVESRKWFEQALQRIKETDLPGLVVVIPDGDERMMPFSNALGDRLRSKDAAVKGLFAGAVWICLRRSAAAGRLEKPATLTRIDGDGKVLERIEASLEDFTSDKSLLKIATPIVEKDAAERLERAWKRVDADAVKRELAQLASDDPDVRDAASKALAGRLPAVLPILIAHGREAKDPEVSGRCAALVNREPALPFGAQWVSRGGCGDPRMEESRIACGRGRASEDEIKLLKFLTLPANP